MKKSDKLEKIISEIHKKTINREIEWEVVEDGKFQLRFPKSSVILGISYDHEDPDGYIALDIFNQEGVRIMEIHGGNIGKYVKDATSKLLDEIFAGAKDSVLKTDETFDDMLQSLTTTSTSTTSTSTTTTTEAPSKVPSLKGFDLGKPK